MLLVTVCLANCSALAGEECDYETQDHARVLENLISELIEPTERPAGNHVVWRWADDRYEYARVSGCVDVKIEVGIVYEFAQVSDLVGVQRDAIDLTYSFMTGVDFHRLVDALDQRNYETVGPQTLDGTLFLGVFIQHPYGEIVLSRENSDDEERISVSWPIT